MFYALYAVSVAAALAGEVYDVTMTERGLAAKVAVEANDWIVGPTPSALALYMRDGALIGLFVLLPLAAHLLGNEPLAYGCLAGPVVAGAKHLLGGLSWKKLLKK